MRFSLVAVVATAFGVVHASTPTVVSPTADAALGVSIDFKYVNSRRTRASRLASSFRSPTPPSTRPSAPATSSLTRPYDSHRNPDSGHTEPVEGQYSFIVIKDVPSGSIFEKDFLVTLSFAS
ncbi:hypothetical protein GSI_08953 [Ganoderma sinense ZZ0214-1]|uniref:Transporter n=1 Tax=Ganoderma sinense ZZ0214-1 TaxID=1077348 RepID=A0A2G8S596_9APHY|nr:hypothetical protein GSI_08953 [Ganoderma sinense ZZ0214-1]